MSYNKAGDKILISIYIPQEYHQHARESKHITNFIQSAIVYYCEKLREKEIIKEDCVTVTIGWSKWFQKLVDYHKFLSPCITRSEFVRHAIFYYMKEDIKLNKICEDIKTETKIIPLEKNEIRVNNGDTTHTTYKILRRLE